MRALDHVVGVTEPLASPRSISLDGTTAFAAVQFDAPTAELGRSVLDALLDTGNPAEASGVQVEFGGELPTVLKDRSTGPAEMIGIVAALIILTSDAPSSKMIGVGLATAVAVGPTIVRMVLVPSTMSLVGDANWWLPRWLDRILPHLDLEADPEPDVAVDIDPTVPAHTEGATR